MLNIRVVEKFGLCIFILACADSGSFKQWFICAVDLLTCRDNLLCFVTFGYPDFYFIKHIHSGLKEIAVHLQ